MSVVGDFFYGLIKKKLKERQKTMKTPHKYAEFIKAWADGYDIEFKSKVNGKWYPTDLSGLVDEDDYEFRIKKELKPDIVKSFYAHANHNFQGMHISARRDDCHNLVLTFDGETGQLKSAEVL